MPHPLQIGVGLAAVAVVVAVATQGRFPLSRSAATVSPDKRGHTYLLPSQLPDSLKILPPPPASGSPAMKRDLQAREAALKLRGTPRYELATFDSKRDQPRTAQAFACALGVDITQSGTPTLYKLLAAMRVDVRSSAYRAKGLYQRPRPYEVYHTQVCSPTDEQLAKDEGSYPSARAAVGWAYALVLADLDPARSDAVLQRGREFGQSRMICDASWQSDIDAGRKLAEEDVKSLKQSAAFRNDFNRARAEVATATRSGKTPQNCKTEALALAAR